MARLTAEEKQFYKNNGYVVLKNPLPENVLSAIIKEYDKLFRRMNQEIASSSDYGRINDSAYPILDVEDLQYHHAVFSKLLFNENLLDAMVDIMGTENIILHRTKAHYTLPSIGGGFPMHQDCHYFRYEKDSMVTAFLHLDSAGTENGGLCVYPGSHKLGPQEDVGIKDGNIHYVDQNKFPVNGATSVYAECGDVVLFSCLLIHGSAPNLTPRPRKMLVLEVAAAEDKPIDSQELNPGQSWLLRGVNLERSASLSKRFED